MSSDLPSDPPPAGLQPLSLASTCDDTGLDQCGAQCAHYMIWWCLYHLHHLHHLHPLWYSYYTHNGQACRWTNSNWSPAWMGRHSQCFTCRWLVSGHWTLDYEWEWMPPPPPPAPVSVQSLAIFVYFINWIHGTPAGQASLIRNSPWTFLHVHWHSIHCSKTGILKSDLLSSTNW